MILKSSTKSLPSPSLSMQPFHPFDHSSSFFFFSVLSIVLLYLLGIRGHTWHNQCSTEVFILIPLGILFLFLSDSACRQLTVCPRGQSGVCSGVWWLSNARQGWRPLWDKRGGAKCQGELSHGLLHLTECTQIPEAQEQHTAYVAAMWCTSKEMELQVHLISYLPSDCFSKFYYSSALTLVV